MKKPLSKDRGAPQKRGHVLAVTSSRPEGPLKSAVRRHKPRRALPKANKEHPESQRKPKLGGVIRMFFAVGFIECVARVLGFSAAEMLLKLYHVIASVVF